MKAIIKTIPVSKARPRFSKFGTYTPKKTQEYEKLIRNEFIKQCKICNDHWSESSLSLKIVFNMPIPKSISKKKQKELIGKPHTKKPDIDNLAKAVMDSLNGIAWNDDKQIVLLSLIKKYSEEANVEIEIEEIKEI